ncbi:molybdopterin-guanine dinucleotide biosynthesis protein B [Desulfobacula toluolica]|uniref:MobB2: molybdopterin-guanine dinucleotide biosynthesis protein B n=1 Tax=Desulfobacula toluolica (strain DSM 7467 / Tol2) TaxID=651182 RepID=K0NPA5_DESTT|nr:molybdopterin-guanine dinucleotide biosynthesis protein B [Desulfobacula toluolica]CCK82520.1 MobB2: molybdopterin-guanine dinucleotide biosynthesis protein B [Desulfobacula toluolica Tol2]
MIPFHVIGQPGSGKTTLIVDIITKMVKTGIAVGSIKHSSHNHELDKPGKDSFLHRKAGASPVTMMTRDLTAVYMPRTHDMTPDSIIKKFYTHLDIVLIEGWISGPYDKIEVWRKDLKKPPLFPDISKVRAIVTDDPLDSKIKQQADDRNINCFKRSCVTDISAFLSGMINA